jgi:ABC-type glycerol-3-phosphate transport system permease component
MASRAARASIFIVLLLIAITILVPLAFMLLSSFRTMTEYSVNPIGLPSALRLHNYAALVSGYALPAYFGNSLFVSVLSTALCFLAAVPAAYAFAKLPTRWGRRLYLGTISLMMVPIMVTLIPRYVILSRASLIDTPWSLIISYTAGALPYTVYLLTASFKGIPSELIEAATMDGARYWRVILSVIVPLGRSGLITAGILNFVNFWNELVQAMLFITGDRMRTITVVVSTMGGNYVSNMPIILTGLMLASIPVIVVYVFFERFLVAGLTMGAAK